MSVFTRISQPFIRFKLFTSARFKLVAWFVAVLALVLTIFSGAIIGVVHRNLFAAVTNNLINETDKLSDKIELKRGQPTLLKKEQAQIETEAYRSLSVQLYDAEGQLIFQSRRNQLPDSQLLGETLTTGKNMVVNTNLPFERYRVLTSPIYVDGQLIGVLQVGLSLRGVDEALAKLLIGLFLTIPVALIAIAVGGWFLASRALKPIAENVARQRQFIQDASHELRTPLSIIRSNIDVTLQNPEPSIEGLQEKLRTINETAKRMGNVINDLVTLSTSDNQVLRLTCRLVELDRVLRDVMRQMRGPAKKKKINLKLGETEKLIVNADENRIKQVLTILIDNAIKYSAAQAKIIVGVKKTPAVDYAKISVQDTGPGISREDQEKIFERFYRVDKSRARELGGRGLGLAIAKSIIDKHRGYLAVQSKAGKGSRFDIFLPLVSKKADKKGTSFKIPKLFGHTERTKTLKNNAARPRIVNNKKADF